MLWPKTSLTIGIISCTVLKMSPICIQIPNCVNANDKCENGNMFLKSQKVLPRDASGMVNNCAYFKHLSSEKTVFLNLKHG